MLKQIEQWNGYHTGLEVFKATIFSPEGIEGSNFQLGDTPF